ncbi:hypothetical protein V8G54_034579 [Vigna mungo]|uniref:NB-ARC domain-containing protein n=1 Tax=Vigna mungo TaxID=3915 RepID=A0AAQ3MQX8_VIGMU
MNQVSLIKQIRNCLCNKRYVILFDDIWNETFWNDIELALIDNENGNWILVTTRDEKVVEFCKKLYFLRCISYNLLSKAKSLELLCKKAFRKDFDGCCPKDYEVGLDIVRKCGCLPLAIVTVGSLLNRNYKSPSDWGLLRQNLSLEWERNSELNSNLRSCLLYFGMYPEDYDVKCGFVKHERGRKLKEVARQQLMELISKSLVLVSSFTTDGEAKACLVHDLIHEMIRGKMKNTYFCQNIDEHNHLESSGIIRHLTIGRNSNCLSGSIEESQYVRSILIFRDEVSSKDFTMCLLAKYMRLLKSISKLKNLETLDVRVIGEIEITKEITKLRKLRCLLGGLLSSIEVKDSLGSLTSLEKMYVLRIDLDGSY